MTLKKKVVLLGFEKKGFMKTNENGKNNCLTSNAINVISCLDFHFDSYSDFRLDSRYDSRLLMKNKNKWGWRGVVKTKTNRKIRGGPILFGMRSKITNFKNTKRT